MGRIGRRFGRCGYLRRGDGRGVIEAIHMLPEIAVISDAGGVSPIAFGVGIVWCLVLAAAHFAAARDPDRNAVTRFVARYLFHRQMQTVSIDPSRQMRILSFVFVAIAIALAIGLLTSF